MADKMMRTSLRGDDGKAKAVKGDNYGRQEIKTTHKRKLFTQNILLGKNETIRTQLLDSMGFGSGKITLRFATIKAIKITIVDVDESQTPARETERVVYDGSGDSSITVNYEIKTDKYYIEVEAMSYTGAHIYPSSYEVLYDKLYDTHPTDIKRLVFDENITLAKGDKALSRKMYGLGRKTGVLSLMFNAGPRDIKVTIIDIMSGAQVDFEYELRRVVFEGSLSGDGREFVEYEIKSDSYYIEVEATSNAGLYITRNTYETIKKDLSVGVQKDIIRESLAEPLAISLEGIIRRIDRTNKQTKYPVNTLIFEASDVEAQTFTKGEDGYFYVVDRSGVLKKYENITKGSEPVDSGLTWNKEDYGEIVYLFSDGETFIFFTNYESGSFRIPRIYRCEGIDGQVTKVYEADTNTSSIWTRNFGVDVYYNGKFMILAGLYASAEHETIERDLLLSVDDGATFNTVKKTTIKAGQGINSHWHDVAIDHYHGLLWASQGDHDNMHISYSDDLGRNWYTLTENYQPTSIVPFPDKIVFGRDNGIVGLDVLYFPESITDLNESLIRPLKEFKYQPSGSYYSMKPSSYKNETYMNFFQFGNGNSPMIIASGDFGESWHGVWIADDSDRVHNIVCVDDDHVYAYERISVGLGGIVYAKKVSWE